MTAWCHLPAGFPVTLRSRRLPTLSNEPKPRASTPMPPAPATPPSARWSGTPAPASNGRPPRRPARPCRPSPRPTSPGGAVPGRPRGTCGSPPASTDGGPSASPLRSSPTLSRASDRPGSDALALEQDPWFRLGGAVSVGRCGEPQRAPASVLAEQAVAVQLDDPPERGERCACGPPGAAAVAVGMTGPVERHIGRRAGRRPSVQPERVRECVDLGVEQSPRIVPHAGELTGHFEADRAMHLGPGEHGSRQRPAHTAG